jgi:hypothetical protein
LESNPSLQSSIEALQQNPSKVNSQATKLIAAISDSGYDPECNFTRSAMNGIYKKMNRIYNEQLQKHNRNMAALYHYCFASYFTIYSDSVQKKSVQPSTSQSFQNEEADECFQSQNSESSDADSAEELLTKKRKNQELTDEVEKEQPEPLHNHARSADKSEPILPAGTAKASINNDN